ncbi:MULTISPECIES: hypothetical protein [Streptomyces]|uniref:hypothetical protein n=1 Tax=Streptomyces TaxID=1883 RepID=UPI0036633D5B
MTSFIGPTGVGKSTVLRALDWFFNGERSLSLSDGDVHSAAKGARIVVEVEFDGLTAHDRETPGRYAPDGAESVSVWRTPAHEQDSTAVGQRHILGLAAFAVQVLVARSLGKGAFGGHARGVRAHQTMPPLLAEFRARVRPRMAFRCSSSVARRTQSGPASHSHPPVTGRSWTYGPSCPLTYPSLTR